MNEYEAPDPRQLGFIHFAMGHDKEFNPFTNPKHHMKWIEGWELARHKEMGLMDYDDRRGLQSKTASFMEAITNTLVGLVTAYAFQKFLNWAYDITMTNEQTFWIVFWFTIFSVVRSYVVRRVFNREFWRIRWAPQEW